MATWDRYTSKVTSFEAESWLGDPFTIRFFCDDPSGTTYLTKAPVVKLKLTPTVQFVSTNIAWDISGSVSSTGTIDKFTINWGGPTDIGNLSNQSWAGDPKTGNVQYTATGIYQVTATVTDTLGAVSSTQKTTVTITDYVNLNQLYIGTTDDGIYVLTPLEGPTAANTGLTGDNLIIRSARLNPAFKGLEKELHHIWACTKAGVIYSVDGATTWTLVPKSDMGVPTNDAGDSPAPATADLDQIDLSFDPQDDRRVYVLRTTTTTARAWIYYTDDYGTTWSNVQVGVP